MLKAYLSLLEVHEAVVEDEAVLNHLCWLSDAGFWLVLNDNTKQSHLLWDRSCSTHLRLP